MKQPLLTSIIALLLSIGTANAAWTRVAQTSDAVVYAEVNTLKRVGHIATLWQLHDLKTARQTLITMSAGQAYLSTKVLQEFDCPAAKVRTLSFAAHRGAMSSGDAVLSDQDATPWASVFPGSVEETLFNIACAKP